MMYNFKKYYIEELLRCQDIKDREGFHDSFPEGENDDEEWEFSPKDFPEQQTKFWE